jgi:hypothetical protein
MAKGPSTDTWFEHPAGKRYRVLAPASDGQGGHIYGVVRVPDGVWVCEFRVLPAGS